MARAEAGSAALGLPQFRTHGQAHRGMLRPPMISWGNRRFEMWEAMRTLLIGAAVLSNVGGAFAQDHSYICYFNEHGDFTTVESAPASTPVGEVGKSGYGGDKFYSYSISASAGSACPNQVPLGSKSATTVALVRQDSSSCTNEDVTTTDPAMLGGSVTIYRVSSRASGANMHLVGGTLPDTSYVVYVKCGERLGTLKTDPMGHADRTFNFPLDKNSSAIAFELVPEGGASGGKLQSVKISR